jgi:hypothetical protein
MKRGTMRGGKTMEVNRNGRGGACLAFALPIVVFLALPLLLVAAPPGEAAAAVIYEESFDPGTEGRAIGRGRIVKTRDGHQGFTVDRTSKEDFGGLVLSGSLIPGLKGDKGTIEFWLQRRPGSAGLGARDPVLEFVDREDRNFLTIYVQWEGSEFGGGGEIFVDGKRSAEPAYDLNVWGEVVPFGFTPQAGEWVHVALSYGPGEGDNAVRVNGEVLPSAYPPIGSEAQIRGPGTGTVTMTGGRLDFSGVVQARVGAEGRDWDQGIGRGVLYLEHSIVDDLRFHDEPVTSFDLSRLSFPGVAAPEINRLEHDGEQAAGRSGKLVAGDSFSVSLYGTPGGAATFDIARIADFQGKIHLDWRGFGVYLEERDLFDRERINLRDVKEYRVYVSREPIGAISEETPPVEVLEVPEQSFTVEGLEGGVPYYVAVVALMADERFHPVIWPAAGLPMEEVADEEGHYTGTFIAGYGDRYPSAVVVGRLSGGDAARSLTAEGEFEIDASLTLAVRAYPEELQADEKAQSEVRVTVTDANGEPVAGHEVRFLLATTSRFTGVVGGGQFADEVGGTLKRDFRGVTDMFGKVTATYRAGFAAKTAIIVARDMLSSDTGAGYVRTFIRAAAELELEAYQEVSGKAVGYAITVTSSDEWLTADGESRARITALVTRDGLPVEGHRVSFRVSLGSGSIRALSDTTGEDGKSRAVYTAGRKIGVALISAVDQTVGISGYVQIELRSDAPAKIAVTIVPDHLPADGRSTAEVEVTVTDINDNPNEGVEVEYQVAIGSGRLRRLEKTTDKNGTSTAEYVAGRTPGRVTVEVIVRSAVPGEDEMLAARALALAVTDYTFF